MDESDGRGHSRIPALGPRGEGWVVAQLTLFGAIAGFGLRDLMARPSGDPVAPVQLVVGGVAIASGGFVALRGVLDLGRNLSPFPRPLPGSALVDTGAYRLIRHPIYCGLVVGAIGWSVAAWSIGAALTSVLLLLLFDAKSRREEVWLTAEFAGYAAYRARTKRLIPGIY